MNPKSKYVGVNFAGGRVANRNLLWRARVRAGRKVHNGPYRATDEEASNDYVRMHVELLGHRPEKIVRDGWVDDAPRCTIPSFVVDEEELLECPAKKFEFELLPKIERELGIVRV